MGIDTVLFLPDYQRLSISAFSIRQGNESHNNFNQERP
jgi:hypothetical protein